jgi:hypothetical protein
MVHVGNVRNWEGRGEGWTARNGAVAVIDLPDIPIRAGRARRGWKAAIVMADMDLTTNPKN